MARAKNITEDPLTQTLENSSFRANNAGQAWNTKLRKAKSAMLHGDTIGNKGSLKVMGRCCIDRGQRRGSRHPQRRSQWSPPVVMVASVPPFLTCSCGDESVLLT
jgi:hypothetical protein